MAKQMVRKSGGEGKKKQRMKKFIEKVKTYRIFQPPPPSPGNA
jgi:hypothetical protein